MPISRRVRLEAAFGLYSPSGALFAVLFAMRKRDAIQPALAQIVRLLTIRLKWCAILPLALRQWTQVHRTWMVGGRLAARSKGFERSASESICANPLTLSRGRMSAFFGSFKKT